MRLPRLPRRVRALTRPVTATAVAAIAIPLAITASSASTGAVASATSATSVASAADTAADTAAAQAHPAPHPATANCPVTVKPGYATCLSLHRTDVAAHRGLFKATAGRDLIAPADAGSAAPAGYGPADLQSAYDLPSASAGGGETVAVVDAYDDPDAEADLQVYRAQYGLPVCDTANGCFTKVAQDGSTNYPQADPDWSAEISLDLDMVSAACPNCHILLVEADDNSIANLGTAVNEAVALGARFVSNSYGGPEDPSDTTADSAYYDHPGVAVTASAGDYSYGTEYPAASPYVTAVGGTTLTRDTATTRGWDESAWSGTGSGCSSYEPKPSWQTDTGCANRTIADVSAVADPDTGVAIYDSYQSTGWGVEGGTSVASPLIAAAYALAGAPVAGTNPAEYPYEDTGALNDITSGSNGSCAPVYLCTAGPGYDGPTGLGTPDGVAAFTTGPHGVVTGTITDASTGKPLADAEVDIGTQPTYTSPAGVYDITVPTGTYDVTAEDFGYQSQSVSGVTVTSGQTVTENISLTAVPTVTLSGTVTDGSGQGWPLYAQVSVPGTPAVTYTNPTTGAYTLDLPQGASYDVTVDPVYPGYQQAQQTITATSGSITQNFSVPVDSTACSALGYQTQANGTTETFDGDTTPDGWSVVNASGTTYGWEFDNPGNLNGPSGGSGNFAIADDYDHQGVQEDTELVSPVYDLSQDSAPFLEFDSNLVGWLSDSESIDVSTDGGQTWTSVWSTGPFGYLSHDEIPLPMAANQADVQIRFHYVSSGGYWWELDNVFVGDTVCAPQPGGLLEGTVRDGNTAAAVNGATVTAAPAAGGTGGQATAVTATSAPTPGDSALGGGFYYMFVPGGGAQSVSAAMLHYTTGTATANVADAAATAADFTLQAGRLSVTPGAVTATTTMGGKAAQKVTFADTGAEPVSVNLYQAQGSFSIAGEQAAPAGAAPVRVRGHYSPLSEVELKKLGEPSGPGQQAAAAATRPADAPWTAGANYPIPIMDNAAATDPDTGLVYSVGGYDGTDVVSSGYVYDPSSQQWTELPAMQYAREEPVAAFIGGKLYVTGGWNNIGDPVPQLEIYDPATGAWSAGASMPVPYAGAAVAVLGGEMYVVGGCTVDSCGETDVQVYDPASNTWSTAADYPEPIAQEACGAIGADLYCAGGDTSTTTATSDAYTYDPSSGAWSAIAPLPITLSQMSYTEADNKLLLSGGITGADGGFMTNAGYAYDPSSGTWSALPNSDNVDYRAGGACGFFRIGGETGFLDPQNFTEELPGYGSCGEASVPWLSESQSSFTLSPGQQVTVTVTMNGGDASVTQPGSYDAALDVTTDSPYQVSPVGVTMTVTPPRTWGKITGTVSGLACAGGTAPVAGATVQVDGAHADYTLKTDAGGGYALWADMREDPLLVIAAKDSWQPQARVALIWAGRTVTDNFALAPDGGCASS